MANREIVHAEYDISDLRWVLSHVPAFPEDLANRFHAIGGGVLVGWGPTRTGTNVGPPYRALYDHPIPVGWHSDGGDITVISPWLNLYTTVTGKNLRGDHILGDQVLTRQEAMWLATADEQVVHLGRRPRVDRGREPRRPRGARTGTGSPSRTIS